MDRQDALTFIHHLEQLYLVHRDLNALLANMAPSVTWIGSGQEEFCQSSEAARRLLEREMAEYGGSFQITEHWYDAVPLPGGAWLIYGGINALPCQEDTGLAGLRIRLSAICAPVEGVPKLFHLHLSHPDSVQMPNQFFVRRENQSETNALRRRVAETEQQLAELTENLPGGVIRCMDDPSFSLLQMSRGFLDMLGYTREEIGRLFHDKLIELICPDDRAKVLDETRDSLRNSTTIELEYRMLCKDGTVLWVLDHSRLLPAGGVPAFSTMLMDITQRKNAREALRLSLERHQIIMDQTNDIIFEWDIPGDTLDYSANWEKKFGYRPIRRHISAGIPHSHNIHPQDMPAFIKLMVDTAAGDPYSEAEFRISNASGRFFWCRIRATTQFDSDGRPIKAVGVITDIDADKAHEQTLLDLAQKDSLTGLFNRSAAQAMISSLIDLRSSKSVQAMMIIDLDNFKSVNDQYGHLCGDAVLSDLAGCLQRLFHGDEILSRIGGDEFSVFLPHLKSRFHAAEKAQEVLSALACLTLPGMSNCALSCSLGIALCPADGGDYHKLYQCADRALYQAKSLGKSRYAFYGPELSSGVGYRGAVRSAISDVIDSDASSTITERLVRYAFGMLYGAVSTEEAVQQMLEIAGRAHDVSRVYIFESTPDGSRCSNTFEWCGDGVAPEIGNLQDLAFAELGDYLANFNADGIFYCQDTTRLHPGCRAVLEPQGIRSLLQCTILDDGQVKGFVGFDECRENRYWIREQVESLTLVARTLSTFLIKVRLKERLKELEAGQI